MKKLAGVILVLSLFLTACSSNTTKTGEELYQFAHDEVLMADTFNPMAFEEEMIKYYDYCLQTEERFGDGITEKEFDKQMMQYFLENYNDEIRVMAGVSLKKLLTSEESKLSSDERKAIYTELEDYTLYKEDDGKTRVESDGRSYISVDTYKKDSEIKTTYLGLIEGKAPKEEDSLNYFKDFFLHEYTDSDGNVTYEVVEVTFQFRVLTKEKKITSILNSMFAYEISESEIDTYLDNAASLLEKRLEDIGFELVKVTKAE